MNMKSKVQRIKTMVGIGASAVLLMGSLSVIQAETSEEYAEQMKEVMDLIESQYVGSDIDREKLFEAAMDGMMSELDKYSTFFTEEEAQAFANSINQVFVGIGVRLELVGGEARVTEVFDGGAAKEAGIQPGDVITQVNDEIIETTNLTEVVNRVLGEEGTTVDVTFRRNAVSFTKTLERRQLRIPTVIQEDITNLAAPFPESLEGLVSEVEITSFSNDLDEVLMSIVDADKKKGVKYLIMDMRDNGGGYLDTVVRMGQALLPEGVITTLKDKQGRSIQYSSKLEEAPMQLVVLVNRHSASATEIFSAAVKDSNVGVVIGETTYGKGVAQSLYATDSGNIVKLTHQEFFSPKGSKINGIGVIPNVIVDTPDYVASDIRLMTGDTGEQVTNMNLILQALGYLDKAGDTYDGASYRAVMAFQKDAGLYAYGVCDYTTQTYLNRAYRQYKENNDVVMQAAFDWIAQQESN